MSGDGQKTKPLPVFEHGLKWWVIESERFNLGTKTSFRAFEAVVAQTAEGALANLEAADEKLDKSLMESAIRSGKIEDEYEWEPVSTLVKHMFVSPVSTESDVSELDTVLLSMLLEHEFFVDDFRDDPQIAVGGGVYDLPEP